MADLETRIKLALTPLRRSMMRWGFDRQRRIPLPLSRRIWAWRRGFTGLSYRLYELDKNDPSEYFPDFVDINYRLLHPYRMAINEKLTFSRLMEAHGLPHPRVLGFLHRGRIVRFDGGKGAIDGAGWLEEILPEGGCLVFRPVFSHSGRGIFFLARDGGDLKLDGSAQSVPGVSARIASLDQYLVTRFVQQAPYAEALFARTPNTLRVLTLWDYARNQPFLAAAAHRIGTSRTEPVDNFHGGRGALAARIDVESGELGPGATLDEADRLCWHPKHPETGSPIEGVRVPHWPETRSMILHAAGLLPEFPFVGWDLINGRDGGCFIEGNSPPGTWVWQVHTPLLRDPRARAFFSAHGMI
jgi:hypothetical protein